MRLGMVIGMVHHIQQVLAKNKEGECFFYD
jgi:hypothetical protein